jgi:hypothetical protein
MRNSCVTVLATVLGLSLLGSARAESLKSKLADMVAASAGDSTATGEAQAVAAPPADEAEREVLKAEARDAVDRALENARDGQE